MTDPRSVLETVGGLAKSKICRGEVFEWWRTGAVSNLFPHVAKDPEHQSILLKRAQWITKQ